MKFEQINFQCKAEEKARWQKEAASLGLSLSAWLRMIANKETQQK